MILEELSENSEEAALQARTVGEKILFMIAQPYNLAYRSCSSSASIGIAIMGDQLEDSEALLRRADNAMYQAKSSGRNTLNFFNPEQSKEMAG